MNKKALALWGLKWNPFCSDLPVEALHKTAKVDSFCWRMEQSHIREGGFALITGDPGTGKSVTLRLLANRLDHQSEMVVGALEHPQSNIADFYREMGDMFGVELKPHNRWGGFKALRQRWKVHIDQTTVRPVLIIDEAQEMSPVVLSELRLMTSTHFDSKSILSVVLSGDSRLVEKLRRPDLLPLASRLRTRLLMEPLSRDELMAHLRHVLKTAGAATLMTPELMATLCDHAMGNLRTLMIMGAELLAAGAQQEVTQLDEKLFLEVFQAPRPEGAASRPKPKPGRR
jgi:type II secretory pathway predicted ATPase ExeA